MKVQFMVWSYDEASYQTFCDIVIAKTPREAERKIEKMRPCAVMDAYCKPIPLTEYIAYLQTQVIGKA